MNTEKQVTSWQNINLSGDEQGTELTKKYWKLYDRFCFTSKRDPNFASIRDKFFEAEQELAEKQKSDWLNGHGSSEEDSDGLWY